MPVVIHHDARRGYPDAAIGLALARTDYFGVSFYRYESLPLFLWSHQILSHMLLFIMYFLLSFNDDLCKNNDTGYYTDPSCELMELYKWLQY